MKTSLAKLLAIVTVALVSLAAGMLFSRQQHPSAPPGIPAVEGEAAALNGLLSLSLPDASGHMNALEQWRGRTLVINFWATWCPPCRKEMPAFSRLQEQYRNRNVQFLGIAVDTPENVQDFAAKTPVSYPLLVGGNEILSRARDLGNLKMGLPFTLIIDAQGRIHARKLGGIGEAELEALLRQTPGTAAAAGSQAER